MKIIVTGFEPFNGESINPSYEIVKKLPKEINGCQLLPFELPTSKNDCLNKIIDALEKEKDIIAVVSVGQAGGRSKISIERVAINCDDYNIPDNDGLIIHDQKIIEDGPDAYFSSLPIRKIEEAIKDISIEVEISNTAGTYICNHVFYSVRHICESKYKHIQSGFIHVPYIHEQTLKNKKPYMDLEDSYKAIYKALEIIINNY